MAFSPSIPTKEIPFRNSHVHGLFEQCGCESFWEIGEVFVFSENHLLFLILEVNKNLAARYSGL
jgi:hypothetical protein